VDGRGDDGRLRRGRVRPRLRAHRGPGRRAVRALPAAADPDPPRAQADPGQAGRIWRSAGRRSRRPHSRG
jgi:hypothetical protein